MIARQFTPVPYDATTLVRSVAECGCVWDLYQRAHRRRWEPFEITATSLSTSWACSTRRVWDILGLLEKAGLIAIERGTNRAPSTVTVFDPTREDADLPIRKVSRKVIRKVIQNNVDETPVVDDSESQGESQGDSQVVLTLSEAEPEPEPEHENTAPPADAVREPQPLLLAPPPSTKPDDWKALADHYATLPWARLPTDRSAGNGKHLAAILKGARSLDDARLLLDWWACSTDDKAYGLRNGFEKNTPPRKPGSAPAYGLKTLVVHLDDYLERAVSWRSDGRPGQPSTDTAPRLSPTEQDRADAERFAADADRRAELRKARLAKLAASPPPLRRGDL